MKFKLKEQFEGKIKVKGITLLSKEEALKLPKGVLKFYGWWWLRSSGYDQFRVSYVDYDGLIYLSGISVDMDDGCVRPALICENLESLNLKNFEKIEFCGVSWVKISDNMLLCDDNTFGHQCFDPDEDWNWDNPDCTYENSDIYKYIHDKWGELYKGDIKQQQMNDNGYTQITQYYIK